MTEEEKNAIGSQQDSAQQTQDEALNAFGSNATPIQQDELMVRLAKAEQAASSYKDQLLRKAAEFENYKRRTEIEFSSIGKFAGEQIIGELLPILDDFLRSLKSAQKQADFDSFHRGIEMIFNKFKKVLEMQGVREIECVGNPFDVQYHEALLQVPRNDVPPHTVIEEVEKGYTIHGRVIRHSKVIVSGEQAGSGESFSNEQTMPEAANGDQPRDASKTAE